MFQPLPFTPSIPSSRAEPRRRALVVSAGGKCSMLLLALYLSHPLLDAWHIGKFIKVTHARQRQLLATSCRAPERPRAGEGARYSPAAAQTGNHRSQIAGGSAGVWVWQRCPNGAGTARSQNQTRVGVIVTLVGGQHDVMVRCGSTVLFWYFG